MASPGQFTTARQQPAEQKSRRRLRGMAQALRQPSAAAVDRLWWFALAVVLLPLLQLAWGAYAGALGANPIETITRATGEWTLILLLVTLAVTPLRRISGLNWLLRLRRMLGLTAFFYGCLHFVTYVWLDQFFDLVAIVKDIVKRPFITAGFIAFLLLVPLAITSTNSMVRRLGARRWLNLHRLAYVATAVGVLHYGWLVKADIREPMLYGLILALLLLARLVFRRTA